MRKTFNVKRVLRIAFFCSFMTLVFIEPSRSSSGSPNSSETAVCFTPGGNCTDLIVSEIGKAKRTILIQAYSFTSAPIAGAVVEALKRGIKTEVILDKSQKTEKYSSADYLNHSGVPTFIDTKHAIAHNKIIVIDDTTLITGSFNFTKAAQERNAENLLVIHDPEIISLYQRNWESHKAHSEEYFKP